MKEMFNCYGSKTPKIVIEYSGPPVVGVLESLNLTSSDNGEEEQKEEAKVEPKTAAVKPTIPEKGIEEDALKSVVKEEMMSVFEDMMTVMKKDGDEKRVRRDKNLYKDSVHAGVSCDKCRMNPIVGIRYKSATKDNFDLCIDCEAMYGADDVFLKIKRPGNYEKFLEDLAAKAQP